MPNLPEKIPNESASLPNEGFMARQAVDQALKNMFAEAKRQVADEKQAQGEPLDPWAEWLEGQQIDEAEFSELPGDQLLLNHPVRRYLIGLKDYFQVKLDRLTPSERKNPD